MIEDAVLVVALWYTVYEMIEFRWKYDALLSEDHLKKNEKKTTLAPSRTGIKPFKNPYGSADIFPHSQSKFYMQICVKQ